MTAGFERSAIVRDGVELSFVDCGSGPVVLLLHGLAGESGEFAPTMDALSRQFHVVALDQRGHGRSTRVPEDLSREAYVRDAIAVIEHVSPGAPVHLAGQSMGAHTAMLVAAARPDLVRSLVLLEGGEGSGSLEDIAQLGRYFASWPVPFPSALAARDFLGDSPIAGAWVEALDERSDGFWPRFEPAVMVGCMEHVMVPRWEEWAAVRARTLVVYADSGMFSDEAKRAFVSRRPGTQRADLTDAGHDAHLDQFEAWIQVLQNFLAVGEGSP